MGPVSERRFFLSILAAAALLGAAWAEEATPAPASLGDAAPNTWVKLCESKTGGRSSPIFFYAPQLKRFVVTGGRPGGNYAKGKPHYSTEHFDLAARAWTNAYPEGAPYKNASGVTDAPAPKGNKSILGKDAQDRLEILRFASAYGTDTRAHNQWTFDPDSQTLYAYLFKRTIAYDAAKRAWSDLGTEAFNKGGYAMVWGSLCYDPVNKEVLSIGGSSAERGGTPGTHVYKIAENKWEKLACGSEALRGLGAKAEQLRREAWAALKARATAAMTVGSMIATCCRRVSGPSSACRTSYRDTGSAETTTCSGSGRRRTRSTSLRGRHPSVAQSRRLRSCRRWSCPSR